MVSALQKALKESLKEKTCIIGSRSVLGAIPKSKLVITSDSASPQIAESAKASNVPVIKFDGTSVALSKMLGRQYHISALSFTKLAPATVKAIIGESTKQ